MTWPGEGELPALAPSLKPEFLLLSTSCMHQNLTRLLCLSFAESVLNCVTEAHTPACRRCHSGQAVLHSSGPGRLVIRRACATTSQVCTRLAEHQSAWWCRKLAQVIKCAGCTPQIHTGVHATKNKQFVHCDGLCNNLADVQRMGRSLCMQRGPFARHALSPVCAVRTAPPLPAPRRQLAVSASQRSDGPQNEGKRDLLKRYACCGAGWWRELSGHAVCCQNHGCLVPAVPALHVLMHPMLHAQGARSCRDSCPAAGLSAPGVSR